MNLRKLNIRRLFNAITVGNIEVVRELLDAGVDPNVRDRRKRTALIRAVRAPIVESVVVDALLEAGADPNARDDKGCTALQHAHRRRTRLGPGPDPIRRSPSLDEHGNLRLAPYERELLNALKASEPNRADEIEETYIQQRRKAALRQFMPRRELRIIVERLEAHCNPDT